MAWYFFCFFCTILVQNAFGLEPQLFKIPCSNDTHRRAGGCTTRTLDSNNTVVHTDTCHVEYIPPNSTECQAMNFRTIEGWGTAHTGDVTLKPYILPASNIFANKTVLNISFSNINWKTMKLRFQPVAREKVYDYHCRNIVLAHNMSLNDQTVFYYDCKWSIIDGNATYSYILDIEATDNNNKVVNRGTYFFNVPTAQMLSPTVTEQEWRPFIYLEIHNGVMRLHIMPPPDHLNITGYQIDVMKETNTSKELKVTDIIRLENRTKEATWNYSLFITGRHYFVVTPLHAKCSQGRQGGGCNSIESSRITPHTDDKDLSVCIVSVMALVVASLFASYIALRLFKRCCGSDYLPKENMTPPKVLVVYSPSNSLHAKCVNSFVTLLRNDYGLRIMYDGDIAATRDRDPFKWAADAFGRATHIIYLVSPAESNYDTYVNPFKDIDKMLLKRLRKNFMSENPKKVVNVFFQHSNGDIPIETESEPSFHLPDDWNHLIDYMCENRSPNRPFGRIAYLCLNQSPKLHISRTEAGQMFLNDLNNARKLLNTTADIC